jgi:hypothetical protein
MSVNSTSISPRRVWSAWTASSALEAAWMRKALLFQQVDGHQLDQRVVLHDEDQGRIVGHRALGLNPFIAARNAGQKLSRTPTEALRLSPPNLPRMRVRVAAGVPG